MSRQHGCITRVGSVTDDKIAIGMTSINKILGSRRSGSTPLKQTVVLDLGRFHGCFTGVASGANDKIALSMMLLNE